MANKLSARPPIQETSALPCAVALVSFGRVGIPLLLKTSLPRPHRCYGGSSGTNPPQYSRELNGAQCNGRALGGSRTYQDVFPPGLQLDPPRTVRSAIASATAGRLHVKNRQHPFLKVSLVAGMKTFVAAAVAALKLCGQHGWTFRPCAGDFMIHPREQGQAAMHPISLGVYILPGAECASALVKQGAYMLTCAVLSMSRKSNQLRGLFL